MSLNEQQIDLTNESQTTDVLLIINDIDAIFQSPNETNLLKMDIEKQNNFNEFEQNSEPKNINPFSSLNLRDLKNCSDSINP